MGLSQQGGGLSPDGPLWSSTIVKKLNLQLANWRSTLIPGPIVELREHPLMYNPFEVDGFKRLTACLLYTSPSPRDKTVSRMPSSA